MPNLVSQATDSSFAGVVLVEDASRVDDDGLAGHGLGAAHGDHHVSAVVLVGWPLQERARCGALDLLGDGDWLSRECRPADQVPRS
jgi:hypothetical protein